MASSELDIWNMALTRIGRATISNLNVQNSTTADLLRQQYPERLDNELEAFDWAFARKTITLLDLNNTDELEDWWTYAYAWPGDDFVAIRYIKNPFVGPGSLAVPVISNPVFVTDPNMYYVRTGTGESIPFVTSTRLTGVDPNAIKIMTGMSEAKARFTYRNQVVQTYPAAFVELMAAAMQVEVAQSIVKTPIASRIAQARYVEARRAATTFTMQEEEEPPPADSIFITGRN